MSNSALGNDEVHIYFAESESADDRAWQTDGDRLLDADERERWQRFVFAADRGQFLLSHVMLRRVLSRYADVPPQAWRFCKNEFGRPEITGPAAAAGLSFNLSHTRGLVACAVTLGREVGIDVEDLQRGSPVTDLAARYFSSLELAELVGLPQERQQERFFELWTLKEAYLKARGVGLSLGLHRFSMHFSPGQAPTISFAPGLVDDPAAWQFAQFRPAPRHLLAVAVRRLPGVRFRVAIEPFQSD
ncbi:MAG TPA: 4'-phosphopantetheinyl transferase superfamily protein [Pirellulales bacterium]|nr:4'-phosphopantetheinyl transferase superfamily protein [Pirellulales bacterium]